VVRDLLSVLVALAEDFPLLAALVDRQAGGQRRLPVGRPGEPSGMLSGRAGVVAPEWPTVAAPEPVPAPATEAGEREPEPRAPTEAERESAVALPTPGGPRERRRPGRYGLTIQFESRPEDTSLGRLVESTVWVNEAHPAYRRAVASKSEGYHIALSVAMALARVAVEPAQVHAFVTAFLGRWGKTLQRGRRRGRRRG
ncbi:MAG: hypothetical protein HY705_10065, partial [Gemmatimonadetes bacterium]|nr:hypothetical protein [Gemmatimonadota bacterium]